MIEELINILQEVDSFIMEDSDMLWTYYETANDLKQEIAQYVEELKKDDVSNIEAIHLLFSPTAALQELSLMNGWSNDYMVLASRFDDVYTKIKG